MQPALFLAGEKDLVLKFPGMNLDTMRALIPHLQGCIIVPGAGHWVPAEYPEEVNKSLLDFLQDLR